MGTVEYLSEISGILELYTEKMEMKRITSMRNPLRWQNGWHGGTSGK